MQYCLGIERESVNVLACLDLSIITVWIRVSRSVDDWDEKIRRVYSYLVMDYLVEHNQSFPFLFSLNSATPPHEGYVQVYLK